MNLGQAVAICLYELVRDAKAVKPAEKVKRATAEELERITTTLLEGMRASGYLDRRPIADVEERMRRLVRRLNLPARDAGRLGSASCGKSYGSCGQARYRPTEKPRPLRRPPVSRNSAFRTISAIAHHPS